MTQPNDGSFSASRNIPHLADQMKQHTRDLQKELDTLWDSLRPMRDSWVGTGSNAYDDCQRNWNLTLGAMANSFDKAHMTLSMAYENYTVTDLQIKGKFEGR
ncbi:WXG100 family type VII secretion target [Nocardia sp. NRRL S-836]|uniref:WXG100 family type VII secretion target n=1 Tax=Nocardia sp. NRRL S-836 TaxID=1519492 RepID=UPI0006AFEF43|nr:WXG100 family type VII secretion target [Nocardia sp. NRRL S-836]KOV81001.1 hypothetical protein ADL03_30490 [Nocardia sp. NRRL S-836]